VLYLGPNGTAFTTAPNTLWKDAFLDIPILIAAKAEYAKLK
jgi:hypothetical protein